MERIGAVLVDTYRIERLIAEGGMGAVYEASHLRIPKKFAIKFLKVSLLDNSVALLRFRREAEVVATLDHPHIVSLLDYNITSDGVPYTILEYLEGEHLGDRVSRGRMPLVEVVRIVDAVCSALAAAHQKGVIHRDLKPENVILCTAGAIKVVDFGIAKLRGGQELTAFNSILGTITYMAPEQLIAGQIDARADQFAIAAMTYEMLSGDMPFGSEGSIPEIAERVLRHQPAAIAGYPPAVHDVLLRAMAKDAAHRYADVTAFCAAFKEVARPLLDQAGVPEPAAAPPATKPVLAPTVERPTVVPKPIAPKPAVAKPVVAKSAAATPVAAPPAAALPATPPPVAVAPSPPAAPVEELPALESSDEGLPELPGDATSISMTPVGLSNSGPIVVDKPPDVAPSFAAPGEPSTGETAMPAETTRITPARDEITDRRRAPTIRPGETHRRPATHTGRMSAIRVSLGARLGRSGGIAVGVILGVGLAVALSMMLR